MAEYAQGTYSEQDFCDTILEGDCLVEMARMPDNCVDMVLCDLPYGVTTVASCKKWDTPVALDALWAHLGRIARSRAALVFTATQPFASALVMSKPQWFRHDWVWRKSALGNFMNAKYRPLAEHEHVLVFGRQSPLYYPQMEEGEPFTCVSGRLPLHTAGSERVRWNHLRVVNEGTRYPCTIQAFPFSRSSSERVHPAQKPVNLFSYLIRTYTAPGDVVLDPCIGSGTTAVSCIVEGRHFIGIERDTQFVAVARQRIAQTAALSPPMLEADDDAGTS